jgi:sensor c-di-GMP phosphodiesterase-like protein
VSRQVSAPVAFSIDSRVDLRKMIAADWRIFFAECLSITLIDSTADSALPLPWLSLRNGSSTMKKRTQRLYVMLLATVAGTALGVLAGSLANEAITLRLAEARLDQYALRLLTDGEASSSELRTVLTAVSAAPNSFCSGGQIDYFRKLIFESEYTKDVGRMRDGKIVCSATLGHAPRSAAQLTPSFIQQDGTSIYMDIYRNLVQAKDANSSLVALPKGDTVALQQGDSYVVFTPITRMHLEPAPLHYTETVLNAPTRTPGRLIGELLPLDSSILTSEGQGRAGETLYSTHCSIRYFNCITAYTSRVEAFAADRSHFVVCLAGGGLLGAALGLIASVLYRRNQSLEQQLRRALATDRLRVFYQPIVDLASERVVGAEALMRWTDEDGQSISPEVFVKLAEDCGFVGEITSTVVRHVLRDLGKFLKDSPDFRVSINVASADLADPRFLPMLERSLIRAGVSPKSIGIEITEGCTARQRVVKEAILHLRRCGHFVYIDDFGTGYSSLAYLHDLSVDAIKIDRAFTQAIGTEAVTVVILPQILAMAASLNLLVVVEGVERREQARYFAAVDGAILAQGWLYGRAIPASDFLRALAEQRRQPDGTAWRNSQVVLKPRPPQNARLDLPESPSAIRESL